MENKKLEKKSVLKKLTIGIAAMALISCAFVGGTFARYESSGRVDEGGGANISDWFIDEEHGEGTDEMMFTISPLMDEYDSAERVHTVAEGGEILRLTNRGSVNADITLKIEGGLQAFGKTFTDDGITEFALEADTEYTSSVDGTKYKWDTTNNRPMVYTLDEATNTYIYETPDEWNNVSLFNGTSNILTVGTVSVETVTLAEGDGKIVVSGNQTEGWTFTLKPGETIAVKIGETTWTSDFAAENGDKGDLRDTWIGENIARVGYKFTWTAEQSSKEPA